MQSASKLFSRIHSALVPKLRRSLVMIWHLLFAVYHYSGMRFVVQKFTGKSTKQSNYREPPSGVIWYLGIHIAAFGFANQQYNAAVETALYLAPDQTKYALLGSGGDECAKFSAYMRSVRYGPLKPDIFSLSSILVSIFGERAPLMDEKFYFARRAEGSAFLTLVFFHSAGEVLPESHVNPFVGFEGFDTFLDDNLMSANDVDLIEAFAKADWTVRTLEDHTNIEINVDGAGALLESCETALSNDPNSVHDSRVRHLCAVHVLGRECAANREAKKLDSEDVGIDDQSDPPAS